jgi:uncharacterized damage-inducible protein DinB
VAHGWPSSLIGCVGKWVRSVLRVVRFRREALFFYESNEFQNSGRWRSGSACKLGVSYKQEVSMHSASTRRTFLAQSALGVLAAGVPLFGQAAQPASSGQSPAPTPPPTKGAPIPRMAPPYDKATINMIGPRPGYTPQIGTMVSMLTWMETAVLRPTRDLTQAQLDTLFDKNANTIGALMLHLAATEVLYQRITFGNENFDKLPADYEAKWGPAMNLGAAGRATIKGHDVAYYQDAIREAREKTLVEFAKHDDAWFTTALKEPGWGGGPINNFCYWFHVCEHISHHAGQIDLLIKRLPGAKNDDSAG